MTKLQKTSVGGGTGVKQRQKKQGKKCRNRGEMGRGAVKKGGQNFKKCYTTKEAGKKDMV